MGKEETQGLHEASGYLTWRPQSAKMVELISCHQPWTYTDRLQDSSVSGPDRIALKVQAYNPFLELFMHLPHEFCFFTVSLHQ